jgi:hypothetical protein
LKNNQVHHARTKHIDIRFHFIREIIGNGISLKKVDTKDNPADLLNQVQSLLGLDQYSTCLGVEEKTR